VRFTLESLPGRSFSGEVETLRMVPVVSNNVVSYTVIVKVANHDGSLLPGMTCAVDFIVERSEDILMVSNAALRYQPTNLSPEKIAEMIFNAGLASMSEEERKAATAAREQAMAQTKAESAGPGPNAGTGISGIMMGGPPRGMRRGGNRQGSGQDDKLEQAIVMRNIWYMNDEGKLDVMQVQAGISDGSFTEIRAVNNEDINGRQVILREKI
jgi:HlyD family secretion protein